MKYRIKEQVNKVTGEKRFLAQTKFLWFWITLIHSYDQDAVFNNREAAESLILQRKIDNGWN
jgi:hypothetical protein